MDRQKFQQGLKDGLPICLGYFPVSFAYGMSVVLSGMPAWAAVLISLTNLTSAGQFAGSSLMLAGGSYLEIAVTTVVINIRYFLMSLAMSQKTDKKMTWIQRLLVSFGITDEIFAVSMQAEESSLPFFRRFSPMPLTSPFTACLSPSLCRLRERRNRYFSPCFLPFF